jgi:hypothetical protein
MGAAQSILTRKPYEDIRAGEEGLTAENAQHLAGTPHATEQGRPEAGADARDAKGAEGEEEEEEEEEEDCERAKRQLLRPWRQRSSDTTLRCNRRKWYGDDISC